MGLLAAAALSMGGCFVHLPADAARSALPATPVPTDAWPRWIGGQDEALDRVRLTLDDRPLDRDISWDTEGRPAFTQPFHARIFRRAGAIVRVWLDQHNAPGDRAALFGALLNGFESNAEILTPASFGTEPERRRTEYRWAAEMTVGGRGMPPGNECLCGLDAVDIERRSMSNGLDARFPPERPDKPRGILIHHSSLLGNRYERAVVAELASRGWIVLSVQTRKSITAPIGDERLAKAVRLERRIAELMRAEPKVEFLAPAPPERAALEKELNEVTRAEWVVTDNASADRAGLEIAQRIDSGLAEGALATRAALEALLELRPELAELPVSMIGFSAGSLAATTIAASLSDRLSCLALVGPACNLAAVGRRSDLFNGGINLVGPDRAALAEPLGQLVEAAYLRYSRLDPYHTAPALVRTPVLVVRGWFDGWVPAEFCNLLIDRLGVPDRLAVPGGHQVLFYLLPTQGPWIADWLDEHTPASPGYARRGGS